MFSILSSHLIKFIFVFASFFAIGSLQAQTYTGTGDTIPDNNTYIYFPINVSGLIPAIIDTTFGLETICLDIIHPYDADLEVSLVSPDGNEVALISAIGGSNDNFTNTCFNNDAALSIIDGSAPYTGLFRPLGALGLLNNNQVGNGIWQLKIRDVGPADVGSLLSWSITFGNNPAVPFSFLSSNLPIIVINTGGPSIPDDPKILVHMGIIDNGPGVRNYMTDPFNEYNGHAGIEIRGSSSQMFPKKSYGFETTDSLLNPINASLCGMAPESDWVLIANYTDKTMMRNVMAYKLFREQGHYSSRTDYCELVINGEYMGVYALMEKIKRDHWRVDISEMTPTSNSGDSLTGGYIFKIDKSTGSGGDGWTSHYQPLAHPNGQTIFFQYQYPKDYEITLTQQSYIQNYVDSFEDALAGSNFTDTLIGYRKYADVNTFIDYFIINEISKNVDGYRLSTFLYKERKSQGGKIHIGPTWDYDIAWYNANYCNGSITSGWAYQFPCTGDSWQVPFWWDRMMQDPKFVNDLHCRWQYLRTTILSLNYLNDYVDTTAAYLDEGQQRNFVKWPILGVYVWPNPTPLPTTYQGEVDNLKTWIHDRILWIDDNLPGICNQVGVVKNKSIINEFNLFPNPAKDEVTITFKGNSSSNTEVEIFNIQGKRVANQKINTDSNKINIQSLCSGIYVVKIISGNTVCVKKLIKN